MQRTNPILIAFGLSILQACGQSKNPELLVELRERTLREGLGLAESFGRQITISYFDGTIEGRVIEGSRYWSFCGPQILVGQTPAGILLANLDGTVFAKSSTNIDALPAALSPNGNLIAFIGRNRDEDTAPTGLQYGPLNSRSFRLIDQSVDTGDDPNRPYSTIGWSPDGRSIAYARDGHVYIYDLDKDQSRVLIEGTNPTWSPDGMWIAYKSLRNEPTIIRPDGNGMRALVTKEIVYGVHWSPEGDYVAFQERRLVSGQMVVFRLRDGARTDLPRDRAFAPTDSGVSWVKTGPRHLSMPAGKP
jgi:Tol biopolymer transport system component